MKNSMKKLLVSFILLMLSGYFCPSVHANHTPQRKILYLNSYHEGYKCSDDILNGIKASFSAEDTNMDFQTEYMDTERVKDPSYMEKLRNVYRLKFKDRCFDLIISSDDAAFKFLLDYCDEIFPDAKVVFCGVNHFEDSMLKGHTRFTGVVEEYDINSTLDMALKLHPETKNIYYICDNTVTGNDTMIELMKTIPKFEAKVKFIKFDEGNLEDIEKKIEKLQSDSVVLLLSYFRDNRNNYIPYSEAISRIEKKSKVPIYGVWDFYLGQGLLGGMLTSGYTQGEAAGSMALKILNGISPDKIPVIKKCPKMYMFDYVQMKKFRIEAQELPLNCKIINKKVFIERFYSENKRTITVLFISIIIIAIFGLVSTIVLLSKNNKIRRAAEEKERVYAMTDVLTGIPNRRAGLEYLRNSIEQAIQKSHKLTVCFLDINDLKKVNDSYGHNEADELIKIACRIIEAKIRSSDMLCRLGGDEFLLILPGTSTKRADEVWNRIMDDIESFNLKKVKPYRIGISYGAAEYQKNSDKTIDELIEKADREMYKDKALYKKSNL